VNALERVTRILERARVAGGWLDDEVARLVLDELGLDNEGKPLPGELTYTSSELGHG
jgi:hypothetical protein